MAEGWSNTVILYESYLIYYINTTPGEIFTHEYHDWTWLDNLWPLVLRSKSFNLVIWTSLLVDPFHLLVKILLRQILKNSKGKKGQFQPKMRYWRPDVLKSLFFELDLITFWFIDAESLFLVVPNLEFQFPLWPKNILNFSWFFKENNTKKWFHWSFSISTVFCWTFLLKFVQWFLQYPGQCVFSKIFLFLDTNTTATLNLDFGFSRIYRFWRSSRFVGFNKIKRRQTMKYPIKTNKLIFMVFQTKENTKSETYT